MKKDLEKISEDRIRKIVRRAILKEIAQGHISGFRWQTCKKLDVPDGYIENEAARETIRQAEKMAAATAQIYGVPGFVCNIFNSIFGDNPEKGRRDAVDKAQKAQGTKSLAFDLYADEFEHLKSNATKFIPTMHNNISSPESNHISIDENDYRDTQRQIRDSTALVSDPIAAVKQINSILKISDRGTLSKVKKLQREQAIDNAQIVSQAVSSALIMHKSITSINLRAGSIASAYGAFPPYERFNNLTDN